MNKPLAGAAATALLAALATPAIAVSGHHPQVLRVGTYKGIHGQYSSIQAAVNAAQPGDWVLVAPGDYKTRRSSSPAGGPPAGVLITKPLIHLRGMNRDTVIVDGTKSGPTCSTRAQDQNAGPLEQGKGAGLDGVMVWKADNVWVENLTVCNFQGGAGHDGSTGNEVWWNGGEDSAKIGGHGFWGNYLTTTSTYFADESTAAQYGIFSSDWSGGSFDQGYASNFSDSGYYIGACQQVCDQTVNHAWAEYNALGYSGSNSGGRLVVENSEFDHNEDGFDTNSQNGDNPPPQDGSCPNGAISPITHTHSCWVFMHNYVHDNNDPNVPGSGLAAAGPLGTGLSLSGARNDTVMDNVFANNDAWGVIVVPFPDSGPPCTGGTSTPAVCLYDDYGNAVFHNAFTHNGGFGNPTNGDIGAVSTEPNPPSCFGANTDPAGLTTSPPMLESLYPECTGQTTLPDANALFADEVACDSASIAIGPVQGSSACLPGSNYPRRSKVVMHPLPGARSLTDPQSATLPSMPDPCAGAPANPWCPSGRG